MGFARSTSIAPPLPINAHSKFAVSVYNRTKNSVIILSQDCKTGFESLSFELMDPKGKTYTIKRIAKKGMTKEAIPQTLESVGILVHHLDFGDKTWSAPPKAIEGQTTGWKIRAKFTLPKCGRITLDGIYHKRMDGCGRRRVRTITSKPYS